MKHVKKEVKLQLLEQKHKELGTRVEKYKRKVQQLEEDHQKVTQEDLKYQKLILQLEDENCFDHEKHISWDSSPAAGGEPDKTVRERPGDGEKLRSAGETEERAAELLPADDDKEKEAILLFFKRRQRKENKEEETEVEMKPGDTQVKEEGQ